MPDGPRAHFRAVVDTRWVRSVTPEIFFPQSDFWLSLTQANTYESITANAGKATIKGVEFDVTYKPVEQLTLNASFQLMEGRYDDFPNGQFFVTNPALQSS